MAAVEIIPSTNGKYAKVYTQLIDSSEVIMMIYLDCYFNGREAFRSEFE